MAIESDMRAALKATGYPVYNPGEYEGRCRTPYIVLMRAGTEAGARKGIQGHVLIDVIEYAPIRDYKSLNEMHARVIKALECVSGCKRPSSVSGDTIESEYQAHARTATYRIPVTF